MDNSGDSLLNSKMLETNHSHNRKIIGPPTRKGMQILDRAAFVQEVKVPSIVITEKDFGHLLKPLKPFLLKIKGLKPTFFEENGRKKRILFNPDLISDLTTFLRTLPNVQFSEEIIESATFHPLILTYDNWTHDQLTNSILPEEESKFSGFTQAGHLIQVNLRHCLLPYKNIIGQILLDKIPNTRTIVNKISNIESEFRNFQMEVIAGEPNTVVKLKENHCEFEFDFANVYWNSRLSSEHERIVKNYLRKGDTLFDMFAGIGPFAVPAAKKKCFVLANDLNPESTKWLNKNIAINKVNDYVQVFNKDAREFLRQDVASYLRTKFVQAEGELNSTFHVTMNLPVIAVEFLDAFWNLFNSKDRSIPADFKLIVHVYCFIKDIKGFKEKALALVKEKLKFELPSESVLEVFYVRNVAPNKEMLRVSFVMPHKIMKSELAILSGAVKRKLSELDYDELEMKSS